LAASTDGSRAGGIVAVGISNLATGHPNWHNEGFWERFRQLEQVHAKQQAAHERARRDLDGVRRGEVEAMELAWRAYRQALDDLDATAAAFLELHAHQTVTLVDHRAVAGTTVNDMPAHSVSAPQGS
jgi:hypothetical protein